MARLVLFTSGTLGDHLPYLALGQTLQARGHEVLLVINQAMHKYAARAGLEAVALTDVERGPSEARRNAWAWDHWRYPAGQPPENAADAAQPPESFVRQVHELASFCEGADMLLATAIRPHGLPAHLISGTPWMTVAVTPSIFALPPAGPQREMIAGRERAHYESIRPLLDHAVREAGGKALTPSWYYGSLWAPRILLGSSAAFWRVDESLLRPLADLAQSGFWLWQDPAWENWRPSPALEAFCAQKPLVLAFSSQPLESPREILQKHARAAALLERPLLVQRGWAAFDEADLPGDSDRSQVMFIDYAPHDWLFARAAAAIQHGGIGSLARALRQGCPLIIEPFGNDQFFNARRVTELGAGLSLHPYEATAENIAAAVQQALSRRTRLRARQLGRELNSEAGTTHAAELIESALETPGRRTWAVDPLARFEPGEDTAPAGQEIPRIVHHMWKDRDIPDHFRAWYESWRTHHPQWEFRLWTDDDLRALIAEHYAWFLPVYDGYTEGIKRADAARYFVLYHYGGLYADLDYEALRPLDPLLAGHSLVLTEEPPAHVQDHAESLLHARMLCNALIASVPGHPFWRLVFDLLLAWRDAPDPLDATGPFLLSRAYAAYRDEAPLTLLPYQLLCPLDSVSWWPGQPPATRQLIARDAYALHHWYGSWWREPVVAPGPAALQVLDQGEGQEARLVSREWLRAEAASAFDQPLISCLMVTRERPLLAQMAIHCFRKQTYAARELVIVDDGPDERLADWVAELGDPAIRLLRLPDEGRPLGALRTLALEAARGDFIAQWDDDDLSAPERLALQLAAVSAADAAGCLLTRQLVWLPAFGRIGKSALRLWEGSALLARRLVDGYPALARGEDTPVIERIAANERLALLDMPDLYIYVFHGGNTFDQAHWAAQWAAATARYDGFRYGPALEEVKAYLGVEMGRWGAYLGGQPAAGSQQVTVGSGQLAAHREALTSNNQQVTVNSQQPMVNEQPHGEEWPDVLILTPVKDAERFLDGFLTNVQALSYPPQRLSIAFLESDSRDGTAAYLEAALPALRRRLRRAELLRHDFGFNLSGKRWEPGAQRRRREILARSRNVLLQGALRDEAWVLWIDVDLLSWPPDVIEQLLAAKKRLVVPNCLKAAGQESFDLNSFQLAPDAARLDWSPYLVDGLLQPPKGFGRRYLSDLSGEAVVPLDGVGGTMLLVDADLHREGLIFPPFPMENLIETEGLAVLARRMGVQAWGLPQVIVRHR